MITTSKYEENGFAEIISGLVKVYDPKLVVELGTQQGASAIIIGKALKQGKLHTYDSFAETYDLPPHAKTKADPKVALMEIDRVGLTDKIEVFGEDAFKVYMRYDVVDILHIDLCNHYSTIARLFNQWRYKVTKCIILEGGGYNKWQRELGFKPFTPLLRRHVITNLYDVVIITKNEDYALTILTRRDYDTDVQSENGPDGVRVGSWRVRVWDGGGRSEGSRTYGCPKEVFVRGEPFTIE